MTTNGTGKQYITKFICIYGYKNKLTDEIYNIFINTQNKH